ncbi:tRNA adenosine(34) deaminase TadA [Thiopseudomonas alkaliphila]|uniref:tRNA-specific adenosine deaminase n=1 Tax=Thiopseudomonas alkaliphila TaxID=1697053 RepID=A0AAW7DQZ1_9GAMM|nr:tRNA adenosine(34) deaminase TadA [Thiopseudomonas alkaliphila]MDM1696585.1 tRNA adenosine(34) deaminase TadA [Thiopseudomonas alkaliphila]MDM1715484.1 tRNA adenosine(34) deaminase TadA [Thiopseudomonas alkaliphila]
MAKTALQTPLRYIDRSQDLAFMQHALALAKQAAALGEVPVGALVVENGVIIGEGFNQPIAQSDPSAHAEVMAIRAAAQFKQNYRLPGATLYVTLEPCTMCAGLIIHTRIQRVVFAALEPRSGAVISQQQLFEQSSYNHKVQFEQGLLAESSSTLLKEFFQARRKK